MNSESSQFLDLMQSFGVSRITATVYRLLLTKGQLSKFAIVAEGSYPTDQIERSLTQLIRLRLVNVERVRGQERYYATNPALSWLALTAELVWGQNVDIGPIENLRETNNRDVENLRMLCHQASDAAIKLYKAHNAVLAHKERDAESLEELAQLICECIYQSQQQIRAVSKSPKLPQVSSFWAVLTSRINAGVAYSRIVDLEEIIDHGLTIVRRDIEEYGIDLRILEQKNIEQKFYIIDNKLLAVFHGSAANDSVYRGVGRVTNQDQVIKRFRKRFNQYREASIPGAFVIDHLQSTGDRLLKRASGNLSPLEIKWVQSCIEYGKFSKFHNEHKWSKEQKNAVEQKALKAGCVIRNKDGFIVPNYPTDEIFLRKEFKSSQIN